MCMEMNFFDHPNVMYTEWTIKNTINKEFGKYSQFNQF